MEEVSADLVYRDGETKHLSCDIGSGEDTLLAKLHKLQKLSNDVLTELVLQEKAGDSTDVGVCDGVDEEDLDSSSDKGNEPDQKKTKREENHQ